MDSVDANATTYRNIPGSGKAPTLFPRKAAKAARDAAIALATAMPAPQLSCTLCKKMGMTQESTWNNRIAYRDLH